MPGEIGKRYECETCRTQVLCLKAGDGDYQCCAAPMVQVAPKALPSSD